MQKNTPILVFAYNFYPQRGGIQTYSYQLCSQLHREGYKIIVLARNYQDSKSIDNDIPFRIIRMRGVSFKLLRLPISMLYLAKVVIRHRIKIVHCISWLPTGIAACLLHLPLHFRYIVTCHGGEITQPRFIKRLLLRSTLSNASWIIAGNKFVKKTIDGLIDSPTPVSIINFGVDLEKFHKNIDSDFLVNRYSANGKKIILTVADLKPRKGVDKTLEAIKQLQTESINPLYIVVGKGKDLQRLRKITHDLELEDQVIFTGEVPDEDLPFYYAMSDIFIMPNRKSVDGDIEGFGIVFIEASATGTPVIAGKSGGVEDAVIDNRTGILVDGNNSNDIANAIRTLLTNSELYKKMTREGIERVRSLFQWETVMIKTSMIYTRLFTEIKRGQA